MFFFLKFSFSYLLKKLFTFSDNPKLVVVTVVIFNEATTVDNYN